MLLLKKMYNSFELYYLRKSNFGCKHKLILKILYIIQKIVGVALEYNIVDDICIFIFTCVSWTGLNIIFVSPKRRLYWFYIYNLSTCFYISEYIFTITYYCYISITISTTLIIYIDCSFYITFYRSFWARI